MILAVVTVFGGTCLLFAAALKLFPVIGLLDFPERYNLIRTQRLPYPVGIVAVLAFLIWLYSGNIHGQREIGLIIALLLLVVVTFIDDRRPLPSPLRLGVQIFCALIVFTAGSRIYTITNPLGGVFKLDSLVIDFPGIVSLPVLSGIFTVAWLLLTINAMNWLDGVSGQVNAVSVVGFTMLGFLALFRNGEPETATIAFVLAAIALAGLFVDFPPAKALMGDSGSMFFGFMLGLLGIFNGGKVATVFLVLGVPLVDAVSVVIRRMLRKTSPFKGGRDHLHHLLLDRGWSERGIILLSAGLGGIAGTWALFLSTSGKAMLGLGYIVVVIWLTIKARKSNREIDRNDYEHA